MITTVIVTNATSNATIFTQDVMIVVNVRSNSRPIVGGPGNAAQFDGIDDFYIADHLAWPKKDAMLWNGMKRGLSAITIEFWAYVDVR